MDESVINGANLFFPAQIGIPQTGPDASRNQWLLGLVNGAPSESITSCLPSPLLQSACLLAPSILGEDPQRHKDQHSRPYFGLGREDGSGYEYRPIDPWDLFPC